MSSPLPDLPAAASPVAAAARLHRPEHVGEATGKSHASLMAQQRANLNSGIVHASLSVSIQSGNEPLALLYRTAIDRLNEILAPELGPNAIGRAASEDHSAEATAARIVALSTGQFDAYKAQHPGEDEQVLLDQFMDLIRSGFEQGYEDARGILDGLKVLQGDVASGIERTHELVLKGFEDFVASHATPSTNPATG